MFLEQLPTTSKTAAQKRESLTKDSSLDESIVKEKMVRLSSPQKSIRNETIENSTAIEILDTNSLKNELNQTTI